MFRVNLGDSNLLARLIPGGLLLIAVAGLGWSLIAPIVGTFAAAAEAVKNGAGLDSAVLFTAGVAVVLLLGYVAAMFLGAILAVIMGYLELWILDHIAARHLRLSKEEYAKEWCRYVDSLEDKRNPYVSRVVESFTFEFRTGLAGVVACGAFLYLNVLYWYLPLFGLIVSAFLIKAGIDDHYNLAEFRHRRFAMSTSFPDEAEEVIRKLVVRWCERLELRPLAKLAPLWPPTFECEGLDAVILTLEQLRDQPPSVLYPVEMELISRAIASLRNRQVCAEKK